MDTASVHWLPSNKLSIYSKTRLKRPLKGRPKIVFFKSDNCLMQVRIIPEGLLSSKVCAQSTI